MKTLLKMLLLLLAVCPTGGAFAQSMPEFTGAWTKGGPFSAAGLKGKAVVLYFYDAG